MGINFLLNNLDKASSPYLRQHASNPVHWQEWNSEVLEYARKSGKPVFLSIGYSSCHWCHVMAAEAFSDEHSSFYLNTHFVSIKVDREERPDIDRVMMDFLVSISGSGGWPLNVFLSSEAVPFFACTYAPLVESYGIRSFNEICELVYAFYIENRNELEHFSVEPAEPANLDDNETLSSIEKFYDRDFGGFGFDQKFPNYCTLLFMIYSAKTYGTAFIKIIEHSLSAILTGGLHDHLQGGFFRYTVDREWQIPHFEKMLYDQAMLLWVFSLGFRLFRKEEYRAAASRIVKCLDETFYRNGAYISAHDADTGHGEGSSYIWELEELKELLAPEEFLLFNERYTLPEHGNFEGKIHLLKKTDSASGEIEEKLLSYRKKRVQPNVDEKIITSWNALAGIAFVEAFRAFGDKTYLQKGMDLFAYLESAHMKNGRIVHSSINGIVQNHGFLEDAASMLLLATYLYEENPEYISSLDELHAIAEKFIIDGRIYESVSEDFLKLPAERSDRPLPSSIAIMDLAKARLDFLRHRDQYRHEKFFDPFLSGFSNIPVLLQRGEFHIYTSPEPLGWERVPVGGIQRRGEKSLLCHRLTCRDISGEDGEA